MGNSGTKKSRVGPINFFDQNPPKCGREDGIWGVKLLQGELTAEKPTLVPSYVKCCTAYCCANPFGSLVGLVVLEMFCRLHFLDKTAKNRCLSPKNDSFFSFLWLICHISVSFITFWIISSSPPTCNVSPDSDVVPFINIF